MGAGVAGRGGWEGGLQRAVTKRQKARPLRAPMMSQTVPIASRATMVPATDAIFAPSASRVTHPLARPREASGIVYGVVQLVPQLLQRKRTDVVLGQPAREVAMVLLDARHEWCRSER